MKLELLRERCAREVRAHGYVLMDNDDLNQIWGANPSTLSREELIRWFAAQIEAQLERWDERGALFTRVRHDAQP